jgi:peptidoglycan/LPS O-acetylase OafA/YrhL
VAEPSLPAKASARFAALDSWRGICALSVVLFHLNAATHFHRWLNNGYVAVDFFFVLSGFVIASAYAGRIADGGDFARFSVRRVGRLYPLHLVVLLIYLVLELTRVYLQGVSIHGAPPFSGQRSWPAFFADLFLVQGFNSFALTWNAPAWSISVELWTNFAFALLVLSLGRRLTLGIAILAVVLGVGLQLPLPTALQGAEADMLSNALQCMFEFFLGVLGFRLFAWARAHKFSPPPILEWAALAATIGVFAFAAAVHPLLRALAFLAVVLIFAFEAGPLSALLKRRPALKLGEISYSIYLTHSLYTLATYVMVGQVGRRLGVTWVQWIDERDLLVLGGPWVMDLVALGCLASVIASSLLTYRFIEDPARIAFNRLSNRIAVRR